jgi:hypothetical protein
MSLSLSLILDIVIVVLLVPTILFAWVLNSRLADLRRNRDELARLIATFNDATQRAESGIPKLRRAADDAARGLQDRVEKAQTLRDDLAFMVDRAEATLGRMEKSGKGRPGGAAPAGRRGGASGGTGSGTAERVGPAGLPAPPPLPSRAGDDDDHATPPRARGAAPAAAEDFFIEDERSEAERELLRALQSGR